jgi:hypothetical protein
MLFEDHIGSRLLKQDPLCRIGNIKRLLLECEVIRPEVRADFTLTYAREENCCDAVADVLYGILLHHSGMTARS